MGIRRQLKHGPSAPWPFLGLKQVKALAGVMVSPELSQHSLAGLAADLPLVFLHVSASLSSSLSWQGVAAVV